MTPVRALVAMAAVVVSLILQVTLFSHLSWEGVVPNLCLLVVVGAALVHGSQFGMVLGFAAGVLLDLAPPADHVVGRWALALMVVGYVAGMVRQEARPHDPHGVLGVVATVAACSFVGTSVFALTGVLLSDPTLGITDLLTVIGIALVWDVLLTPFVLPVVIALLRRLEPARDRRVLA